MTRRSDELFSKKELYERTMYSFEFILSLIEVCDGVSNEV